MAKNLLIYSLVLIFIAGCSIEKPEISTTSPIEAKLINAFKDDYKLDITAKLVGKTLWVYIPVEYDILTFDRASTLFEIEKTLKFNVRFIDGNYQNKTFDFKFYIDENPELPKMEEMIRGVTYDLTEKSQEININAYHYLEETAWGYPDEVNFFVLTIADIKRGIEFSQTISALDLKKSSRGSLPPEEFSKRTLNLVRGDQEIVDNKDGSYLKYANIEFFDFIIEQVTSRVKLDIPTKETITSAADINKLILETLWKSTRNYEFDDFFMVKISNMVSKDVISYSKPALEDRFGGSVAEGSTKLFE